MRNAKLCFGKNLLGVATQEDLLNVELDALAARGNLLALSINSNTLGAVTSVAVRIPGELVASVEDAGAAIEGEVVVLNNGSVLQGTVVIDTSGELTNELVKQLTEVDLELRALDILVDVVIGRVVAVLDGAVRNENTVETSTEVDVGDALTRQVGVRAFNDNLLGVSGQSKSKSRENSKH